MFSNLIIDGLILIKIETMIYGIEKNIIEFTTSIKNTYHYKNTLEFNLVYFYVLFNNIYYLL